MDGVQPTQATLYATLFRDSNYLAQRGPLTLDNVLEYFRYSPFFDRRSNNATLEMQSIGQAAMDAAAGLAGQQPGTAAKKVEERLAEMTGLEYAVVHARPPGLFIIHKRYRKSPTETHPVAAYLVLNDNITQAPDVHTVLGNRLLSTIHNLRTTLSLIRRAALGPQAAALLPPPPALPRVPGKPEQEGKKAPTGSAAFSTRWGHGWVVRELGTAAAEGEEEAEGQGARGNPAQPNPGGAPPTGTESALADDEQMDGPDDAEEAPTKDPEADEDAWDSDAEYERILSRGRQGASSNKSPDPPLGTRRRTETVDEADDGAGERQSKRARKS